MKCASLLLDFAEIVLWAFRLFQRSQLLDEGIEAVAQSGVGDAVEFGHVLEIAAGLEEAEHEGMVLWGKAGQRRQGKTA